MPSAADRSGAAERLHSLSGVASFLQARQLARLAVAAEGALRNATGPASTALPLLDELALAITALEAFIDQIDAAAADA